MVIQDYIVKVLNGVVAKRFLLGDQVVVITGNYAMAPQHLHSTFDKVQVATGIMINHLQVEVRNTDPDTPAPFWVKYGNLMEIKNIDE